MKVGRPQKTMVCPTRWMQLDEGWQTTEDDGLPYKTELPRSVNLLGLSIV
jgi:hypothetical protein